MGIVHADQTNATAKLLYGTAFMCAYPNCKQPLYQLSEDGLTQTLNSRICHIAAKSEGGPRWDPDMSEDENRSAGNLLLLCSLHAWEIDQPGWPDRFPTHVLLDWKQQQIDLTEKIRRSWELSDAEAEEVVRVSEGISMVADTVNLGGAGGVGLGAGGGGGGAIGPGSSGGPGGRGGSVNFGPGLTSEEEARAALERFLQVVGDSNRGTGSGGAGAVGPNSQGEAGGDGADAFIDKPWLSKATHQVLPGRRGEDTIFNVAGEDGALTEQIIARSPGAHYAPYPATRGRPLEPRDIERGFAVTTMMLADSVTVRRGMVDILNAMWRLYEFEESPFRAVWTLVTEFDTGSIEPDELIELQVLVRDPEGACRLRESFDVQSPLVDSGYRTSQILLLNFTGSVAGTWTIEIASQAMALRSLQVRVVCPPPHESDEGGGVVVVAVPVDPHADMDE